jgi:hypothetical protein
MTRIKLKFVTITRKKNGLVFYYFRRRGFARVALPGLPGSAEFMAAYSAALDRDKIKTDIGSARTIPGTVNAAIAAFYQSPGFTKNKTITQSTDRNILEAFRARHGDKRIALMEERHIRAALADKADKPSAQRNLLRVLRVLLTFAVERGLRRDNPAAIIKLNPLATAGFHTWTEAELQQFEDCHPVGSKARLALALLLFTAQRRNDVVQLGPGDVVAMPAMSMADRSTRTIQVYGLNKFQEATPGWLHEIKHDGFAFWRGAIVRACG